MRDYLRYVFGVIAVILVIVLFVLGFNMIRKIVNQTDNKPTTTEQKVTKPAKLTDEKFANQPVSYTTRGAINGNENYHSIRITITPEARRVDVLQGYNDQIVKTQQTPNTPDAYKAFIDALVGAGFTNKAQGENRGEESQSCLLGKRYNFEAAPASTDKHYTWATSCSAKEGTFGGNRNLVDQLFERQIPKYNDFVRGVSLG